MSYVLPAVLLGVGLFSLWEVVMLRPAVAAYRSASPCGAGDPTAPCYTLPVGTVTSLQTSRTRSTTYTHLQIQLATAVYAAKLRNLSSDYRAAVQPGTSIRVQLFQGAITGVQARGVWLATAANPVVRQQQAAFGVIFLGIGGLIALAHLAFFLLRLWRRRQVLGAPGLPGQEAASAGTLGMELPASGSWLQAHALQLAIAIGVLLVASVLLILASPSR